jgi:hypothetical protein
MRFSLWLWPYARWGGFEAVGEAARRAEAFGFSSISVSDHTIATTGPESQGVTSLWPDWSVLCTYLALRRQRSYASLRASLSPIAPCFRWRSRSRLSMSCLMDALRWQELRAGVISEPKGGLDQALLIGTVQRVKYALSQHGRDADEVVFRCTIGIGRVNAALVGISRIISVDPVAVAPSEAPEQVASEIALNFSGETVAETLEQLEWFGEEVMPIL